MNIKQASSNGQDFNHYLRSLSVPPPFSVSLYKKLNHQKKRDKTPASLQHPMNKTNGTNSSNYQGSKRINGAALRCRFA